VSFISQLCAVLLHDNAVLIIKETNIIGAFVMTYNLHGTWANSHGNWKTSANRPKLFCLAHPQTASYNATLSKVCSVV